MTVPICSVCAWRDKFEFSYIANVAYECFHAQNAETAFDSLALCNFHAYVFHDTASSATTALVVGELLRRVSVAGTVAATCIVCHALDEPERTLVLREADHEPPRLCRAHVNRLRALGGAATRVEAAERSLIARAEELLASLGRPDDPDDPFSRRVGVALRLYSGTPGVPDVGQ